MPILLQIGHATAAQIGPHESYGHIAATLGGMNFESRGSKGVISGDAARGAANRLFKQHFHMVLTDQEARRALRYAKRCVGHAYVLGQVPTRHRGGDCSGFMSGIICRAKGKDLVRLFTTASFEDRADNLGFATGLGGGQIRRPGISPTGKQDRPWPGRVFQAGPEHSRHIKWIQARLNFAFDNHIPGVGHALAETGHFNNHTTIGTKAFQQQFIKDVDGQVGQNTWGRLNSLR